MDFVFEGKDNRYNIAKTIGEHGNDVTFLYEDTEAVVPNVIFTVDNLAGVDRTVIRLSILT